MQRPSNEEISAFVACSDDVKRVDQTSSGP